MEVPGGSNIQCRDIGTLTAIHSPSERLVILALRLASAKRSSFPPGRTRRTRLDQVQRNRRKTSPQKKRKTPTCPSVHEQHICQHVRVSMVASHLNTRESNADHHSDSGPPKTERVRRYESGASWCAPRGGLHRKQSKMRMSS